MKLDKTTVIVVASAVSCTLSAAGSIINSLNTRKNRYIVINQANQAPVSAEVDTVVYEQIETLKELPLKDRLAGLEAIKNGTFKDFLWNLRTI